MKNNKAILFLSCFLVIIVGTVSVFLIINTSRDESSREKFNRKMSLAGKYVQKERWDDAITAYQSAIQYNEKSEEAYYILAQIYIYKDMMEEAGRTLEKGLQVMNSSKLQDLYEQYFNELTEYEKKPSKEKEEDENELNDTVHYVYDDNVNIETDAGNQSLSDHSDEIGNFEEPELQITTEDEWINAYARLLYEVQNEYEGFMLGHVDEDDIPELLLFDGVYTAGGVDIYVYYDGKVDKTSYYKYGSYGGTMYAPFKNRIFSEFSKGGRDYITIFQIKNGHGEEKAKFYNNRAEGTENIIFKYNEQEVSEEQYFSEVEKYHTNDYVRAECDRAFQLNNENIQRLCQDPVLFLNPDES